MKKRLLSLLLAIVMVVGLVPAMVIGVGADGEDPNLIYSHTENVNVDRTEAETRLFQNFFSSVIDTLSVGKKYQVSYSVLVNSFTGTPSVTIGQTSTGWYQQLKLNKSINMGPAVNPGDTISDTVICECQSWDGTPAFLLRSMAHIPAGAALNAEVTIEVREIPQPKFNNIWACEGMTILLDTFDNVPVQVSVGYELKGDKNGVSVAGTGETQCIDLNTLFNDALTNDTVYTLHYCSGDSEEFSFSFGKVGDTLAKMYITSDKTLAELNASKENVGSGQITFIDANGGTLLQDAALTSIKGRGNSSWSASNESGKKPYNIKLEAKAELIDGAGKAKKWCLLTDRSGISGAAHLVNIAAQLIYQEFGGDNAVAFEPIHLYINGEYRGVYLLTESVQIDENRIDITESEYTVEDKENISSVVKADGITVNPETAAIPDISASVVDDGTDPAIAAGIQYYKYATDSVLDGQTGGFVLEIDKGWSGEHSGFLSKHGIPYTVKDPEYATKEQVQQIAIYVQQMEDAVWSENGYNSLGKYYADYIDIDSVAKQSFLRVLMADADAFRASLYLVCDCIDGELQTIVSGPAWDFDYSSLSSINTHTYAADNSVSSLKLLTHLLTHGDFYTSFSSLADIDYTSVLANIEEYKDLLVNVCEIDNTVILLTNDADQFDTVFSQLNDRITFIQGKFLNTHRGISVNVDYSTDTLTAETIGTTGYQWYKIDADGYTGVAVDGATDATFTPTEDGTYYVVATDLKPVGFGPSGVTSNAIYVGDVTVSFDMNGHGTAIDDVTEQAGSTITAPDAPEAEGYTFEGWYKDAACTEAWNFDTDVPTKATLTLFAKWEEIPADPKLSGSNVKKSLSPLENININFKVVNDATNDISQYTDFVLVVEDSEGNEVKRVDDWKWQNNTRYWCALPVLPQDINTVYNIHIEAKNELGEDVHGETFQYGVCTYCDNQIAKELGNGITQELKDLCTAIKAYGAAAKAYFDTLN